MFSHVQQFQFIIKSGKIIIADPSVFGAITDTVHKPHIVVAKKSWVGDYVEFEIRLK